MSVEKPLALCILNCYPRPSREGFDRDDVGHPHDFFKAFLARYAPNAKADVVFAADADAALPKGAALGSYDGFIWTGSDLTAYHEHDERVTRQIALARELYKAGVPCCGSCWAVQIAAVAAGGEVRKNPNGREWGVARDITVTEAGRGSRLLAGKPERYDGFIMHLDEVSRLPPGAALLATNAHTRVQALEIRHGKGVFWSTQYHPEYDLLEMARLVAARAAPMVKEGLFAAEDQVRAHAGKMKALHADPGSERLRRELEAGDDILDPLVRQVELRNWIDYVASPPESR
ncbi:MAG: type 1 glutamine amidotransferase [Elusimicrobiota bacterium]